MPPFSCAKTTSTQVLTSKLTDFWVDKDTPKYPLHHLFKSNLTPSHFEVITIQALIKVAEDRIEELHRFPTRTRTHTRASQVTESRLLEFVEEYKTLLNPMRFLPSEILQEIFRHYATGTADAHTGFLAKVPWHLGHISRRWREIALYFPSLWDNIPEIGKVKSSLSKESFIQAFNCLMERSRTSPTLKFHINHPPTCESAKYPIISTIISHSERIEKLNLQVTSTIVREFQGLKGHLPNLRDLRLTLHFTFRETPSLDIFDTAPALRRVALREPHSGDDSTHLYLPWSQITHFEEQSRMVLKYVPLSSLNSLVYLYINQDRSSHSQFTPPSLHKPTTLHHLRTLKIILQENTFLEYLTIPAIEVIKIFVEDSLVPCLFAMLSRSHEPSRLQKLALRTGSLQPGELSTLLELTPQLIELDIPIPPIQDIQRLTRREGEGMLVPMLQALYLDQYGTVNPTLAEYLKNLAQSRCEWDGDNSEGAVILDMLRINFNWHNRRDDSQRILNNWAPVFNPKEVKAARMFIQLHGYNVRVLRETNIHYDLRHLIDFKLSVRGENRNNLKQRVMHILDRWDRLLPGDSGYWTRTFPDHNHSLVYIPKDKCRALAMSPDYLNMVYGLEIEGPRKIPLWERI